MSNHYSKPGRAVQRLATIAGRRGLVLAPLAYGALNIIFAITNAAVDGSFAGDVLQVTVASASSIVFIGSSLLLIFFLCSTRRVLLAAAAGLYFPAVLFLILFYGFVSPFDLLLKLIL